MCRASTSCPYTICTTVSDSGDLWCCCCRHVIVSTAQLWNSRREDAEPQKVQLCQVSVPLNLACPKWGERWVTKRGSGNVDLADTHPRATFEPHQSSRSRSDRDAPPFRRRNATTHPLAAESRDKWIGGSAKQARATTRRGIVFDEDFPLGHPSRFAVRQVPSSSAYVFAPQ
jgi:hypothetical protein